MHTYEIEEMTENVIQIRIRHNDIVSTKIERSEEQILMLYEALTNFFEQR